MKSLRGEGNVIGLKPRQEVHKLGLRHKGIYLIICDEEGQVFIQQRAKNKDLEPLKWDFSVAEHLKPNESYEDAAIRGAMEELSAKVRNLKLLAEIDWKCEYENLLRDNELNQIFAGELDGDGKSIKFKDREVRQGKFVETRKLLEEMSENPKKFTPWLLNCRKCLEAIAVSQ